MFLCITFQIEFHRWYLYTTLNMFAILSSLSFTVSRSMLRVSLHYSLRIWSWINTLQMRFTQKWMKLWLGTALNRALSGNIPIVLHIYWYNQGSFVFCFCVKLIENEHTLLCLCILIFLIMWTLPKPIGKQTRVVPTHSIQTFTSVILVVAQVAESSF